MLNSALRKAIQSRFIYVAISQICGLVSFTIVVKFLLNSSEIKVLANYQAMQAVTAFLMLSIQYSHSRTKIFGIKFGSLFFIIYAASAFFFFKGTNVLLWGFCVVFAFAFACYSNLLLTALEEYGFLLALQITCSAILPFSIVSPLLIAIFLFFILLALLLYFRASLARLSDMQFFQDGKSWLSSLSMQAPLMLLPVFDPLLFPLIGSEIYRNYALSVKYCTGPINLVFSAAQFRVLERNFFDVRKLVLCCIICFGIAFLLILSKANLTVQVVFLVIFTNFASLLIRTNSSINSGFWSFFVGPITLGGYYAFLSFSGKIISDIHIYFVLGILLSIALNASFSVLGVMLSFRRLKSEK